MGIYLNSQSPYRQFLDETSATYFIDKSRMLEHLIPLISTCGTCIDQDAARQGKSSKYICVTRPRRFVKTMMACMIASFFGKGIDSKNLFQRLKIAASKDFERHINQHNVIYISFDKLPVNCIDYHKTDDCIILELKVGYTPEDAIQQIKNRKYVLRFQGKIGEECPYSGRILAVGIAYDKKSKKHTCKIEMLER